MRKLSQLLRQMEGELHFLINGRGYQFLEMEEDLFFCKWSMTFLFQFEDDPNSEENSRSTQTHTFSQA